MRPENKKRSIKMSSALGNSLPPSRIYHRNEEDVQPTAVVETSGGDNNPTKHFQSVSSPAGDNTAVEITVLEPQAPDIVSSKGDEVLLVEDPLPVPSPVEDPPYAEPAAPIVAAELGSVDEQVETFSTILPVPEKTKKMAFVSPFKPKIPQYKTFKRSCVGPPPPQTAAEELPRGLYVPPASSPYPTLELEQEPTVAAEPAKSEPETEVYPNPFKSSCSVLRLSGGLFEEFLKQMDVVLVMFYKGALGQNGTGESWAKDQFVKASAMTNRTNHAYAAVDCAKENSICAREDVTSFPLFRLYSKGHTVDTIKNYQSFDSEAMQKFVEFSPVLEQPARTESLFSRISRSSRATD